MALNGKDNKSTKLRITGLKEPIVWLTDNKSNKPLCWKAGVGIAGLKPDLSKGYKHKYTRELISPDGKIVDTGVLSQAPGYLGTSTIIAIGGIGLSSGVYTARIWADNGEEDNLVIKVPDYETYLVQKEQQEKMKLKTILSDQNRKKKIGNNNLQHVNEVYLEEEDGVLLLTVERKDKSKYSVVLKDPTETLCVNHVIIDDIIINMIKKSITVWGDKIDHFAEQYLKDDRKEVELFNDIVTFARCLCQLSNEHLRILKFKTASDLLHNRIMAQIMCEYHSLGFYTKPMPIKHTGQKIHDFDVYGYGVTYKCEVKTIQSIGELEHRPLGGYKLTDSSYKSIILGIRNQLADAKKVGDTGIIIISPWSYRINALLRIYFKKQLLLFPPSPCPKTIMLVLTSDCVFEDYYVSFPSDRALSILETAFSFIQLYGISPLIQVPIRKGLTIRASTAPKAGSTVGYSFKPPKEPE